MSIIVTSTAPAYGGSSLGKIGAKIVFVEGIIPGETAKVEITDERRDYSIGKAVRIIDPSPDRRVPPCPVFGICGGCHLQHVSPERQTAMKDEIIGDSLRRIGKLDFVLGPPLTGAAWEYRHRVQIKVSDGGEMGFYQKGTREIVPIGSCPILIPGINLLIGRIGKGDILKGLREIHITLGDSPVAFLKGIPENPHLPADLLEAGFSGVMPGHDTTGEPCHTTFPLLEQTYSVSPVTFIQSHWEVNCRLVEIVGARISESKPRHVLDLYAGAGNFSLPAALSAGRVTAVEENRSAVADGLRNMEKNGVENCRFIGISAERYDWKDHADLIILDPPRAGLTGSIVEKIIRSRARQIIYLSCNPSTLARDIRKLSRAYAVSSLRQIGFFPQTFHIEALAFLEQR